jgi:hypothetical protein
MVRTNPGGAGARARARRAAKRVGAKRRPDNRHDDHRKRRRDADDKRRHDPVAFAVDGLIPWYTDRAMVSAEEARTASWINPISTKVNDHRKAPA